MITDIHCHLDLDYYDDLDSILENAKNNDVGKLIYNGTNIYNNKYVLDIISKYDNVYGAIGFHPTELDEVKESDYEFLEREIQNKKIVAIGEIGLDYHYPDTDKELQKRHFIRQLELAKKYDIPVIIHSRDAIQDTYDLVKKYKVRGVLHCYSGSVEMAREFIKLGIYISIGGVVTFKNAKNVIDVIKDIDLSYLLVETDSPYLTPEPYRGKRNEPAYVIYVVKKIAQIREIDINKLKNILSSNVFHLFDI